MRPFLVIGISVFGVVAVYILAALLVFLPLLGYVWNLQELIACDFKAPYKAEIIRGVGAVTGIGFVLGFMEIRDE